MKPTSNLHSIMIVCDERGKQHQAIIIEEDNLNRPIRLHVFGAYYIRKGDIFVPDD